MWKFASSTRRFIPPPRRTAILSIQLLTTLHLFATTVLDLRNCYGFSMLPTMAHDGEWVLSSPLFYRSLTGRFVRPPERGDLVICSNPRGPLVPVCKRVIGLEGDIVEVEVRRGGRRKWVDGDNREEEVLEEGQDEVVRSMDTMVLKRKGEGRFVKVPKGHVWVTGDNMSNSTDSRVYGPVPYALIKGKVFYRVWPTPKLFRNPVRHLDGPEV